MDLPAKIGIIGCGVISDSYIKRLQSSSTVEVYACADLDHQRAQAKARAAVLNRWTSVCLRKWPEKPSELY